MKEAKKAAKTKGRGSRKKEEIALVMRMQGTAPLMQSRDAYIEKRLGKDPPRQIVVYLSLKSSLRAIVESKGILSHATKSNVRALVWRLFKNKKITFRGGTRVDFESVKKQLEELLGKKRAMQFMTYFKKRLQDERNYLGAFAKQKRGIVFREGKW
ncbi:MAG: hypothetical protein Q8N60_03225 [Candidatus Diapherotrites archaeon]|nr:hypothetical protein [Candidatus Diapherotrites archaeon]